MAEDQEQGGEELEDDGDERSTLRGVSDSLRKAISSGFRTVMQSDDWVRGTLRDAMPKELVTYIKGATDATRDQVVEIIGNQTRKFLENLDLGGELQKILTSLSFEIRTEVRFVPNDKKVKPQVKFGIRPKRTKPDKDTEEDEETEE